MYCIHCGKQNPDHAKYCFYCGSAIYFDTPSPADCILSNETTEHEELDPTPITATKEPRQEKQKTSTKKKLAITGLIFSCVGLSISVLCCILLGSMVVGIACCIIGITLCAVSLKDPTATSIAVTGLIIGIIGIILGILMLIFFLALLSTNSIVPSYFEQFFKDALYY